MSADAAQGIVTPLSPAPMPGRVVSDATGTKLLVVEQNSGDPSHSCVELWRCAATGDALMRVATFDVPGVVFDAAFSPSGRRMAFLTREPDTRRELVAVVYDGESRQELLRSETQSYPTAGILFLDESTLLCGVHSHPIQRGRHLVQSKMVYAYELGE